MRTQSAIVTKPLPDNGILFSLFAMALIFVISMTTMNSANAQNTSQFSTGATFTQYSLDSWGDPAAIARGKQLLLNSTRIVNQHIMGFGALNPEPSPNDYQFDSIDRRIGKVNGAAKDADVIVLTACCAPDWMKGGQAGETDWSRIEEAPFELHFSDYAKLVTEIVVRPEFSNIRYLMVWNEMKGFWDLSKNRWNHEAYTRLYNQIWTAVKLVRPDIKIGGPYVVLNSFGDFNWNASDFGGSWGKFDKRDLDVFRYWFQNKAGADFIIADTTSNNRDGTHLVDQFERTAKFADFMEWLRSLDESTYPGATTLPLWWGEWYVNTENANAGAAEKNAVMATGMIKTIKSGASTALIWGPQGDVNGNMFPLGLFSDTRVAGGGQPTLYHNTQKILNDHFAAGIEIVELDVDNPDIEVLASVSNALLVNKSNQTQIAMIDGERVTLQAFEVKRFSRSNNADPTLTIADQSVNESDATAVVTLTLSGASSETVNVIAFTRSVSASAGADYYGKSETVEFPPGTTSQTISIDIINDVEQESDESVEIRMVSASNATIRDNIGIVTIIDNDSADGAPELSIDALEVTESDGSAMVPVRLSRAAGADVSVLVFTQILTANPGSDYYGRTDRLSFAPGQIEQRFEIQILNDTAAESTETIGVRLTDSSGADIAVDRATLQILDDD